MIRELIKKRLEELVISKRQFAIKIDCDYSTFNNYLNEQRNLPYKYLEKALIELDLLKK